MVSLVCGYAIGFRFHRGAPYIAGYCVLAIAIGALLSFGADLIGTATRNPDAMLPLLTLPILIFGLLSIGLMPLRLFPHWIQPVCPQPTDHPVRGGAARTWPGIPPRQSYR